MATTDKWKDKSGEKQERTEWHRISTSASSRRSAGEYLKKGSQVYIEGRMQTRKWQDKEGQDRYTTEIVADRMQTAGLRAAAVRSRWRAQPKAAARRPAAAAKPAAKKGGGASFDDMDDDIPF